MSAHTHATHAFRDVIHFGDPPQGGAHFLKRLIFLVLSITFGGMGTLADRWRSYRLQSQTCH